MWVLIRCSDTAGRGRGGCCRAGWSSGRGGRAGSAIVECMGDGARDEEADRTGMAIEGGGKVAGGSATMRGAKTRAGWSTKGGGSALDVATPSGVGDIKSLGSFIVTSSTRGATSFGTSFLGGSISDSPFRRLCFLSSNIRILSAHSLPPRGSFALRSASSFACLIFSISSRSFSLTKAR